MFARSLSGLILLPAVTAMISAQRTGASVEVGAVLIICLKAIRYLIGALVVAGCEADRCSTARFRALSGCDRRQLVGDGAGDHRRHSAVAHVEPVEKALKLLRASSHFSTRACIGARTFVQLKHCCVKASLQCD